MARIHAMLEEEIFYPACQKAIDDGALISEASVEHDGAKVLIAELMDSEADNAFYDAKVMVLSEMIKHHVAEEEKNLFPQAKRAGLDLATIGAKLLARKEELVAKFAGAIYRLRRPAALPATSWSRQRRWQQTRGSEASNCLKLIFHQESKRPSSAM